MRRLLAAAGLLLLTATAATAAAPTQEGANYESEDLDAKAPGPRWRLQTAIPEAPSLRGAYIHPRKDGPKDRSSIITFALDPAPGQPLDEYVRVAMNELRAAPLSFKMKKQGAFKSKGRDAIRADYTDKDGIRHFTQIAMATPAGGILVAVLQAPDARAYGEDLPVFLGFVERLEVKSPKAPGSPPKPQGKTGKGR